MTALRWTGTHHDRNDAAWPLSLSLRPRADRPHGPDDVPARAAVTSCSVAARLLPQGRSGWSILVVVGVLRARSGSSPTGIALYGMGGRDGHAGGGARAARHRRPALRARRHAEAAGRDRRHRHAERLRHRPQRRTTRWSARRPASCAGSTTDELEGVLAHELSHVAHRDVAVMTIASFLGIAGRPDHPDRPVQRHAGRRPARRQQQRRRAGDRADRHAGQRRRLRDQLPADPAAVPLPRAGRRPGRRAAHRPALGAGHRADQGHRRDGRIPTQDLRKAQPFNAFFFAPALAPGRASASCSPPTRRWSSGWTSWPAISAAARPAGADAWACSTRCSAARKPVQPDLDQLFALPVRRADAGGRRRAHAHRARLGLLPRRRGRRLRQHRPSDVAGAARRPTDGPAVELSDDSYGYTWLLARHDAGRPRGLVTDLHAVNTSLQDGGFGPQLLCSLVAFTDPRRPPAGLVYLYKRGTFYPFAPLSGDQHRDNALELQVRGALGDDLPIEHDLARWFPVWGAPGL